MKQHISVEQLEGLTIQQKLKLVELTGVEPDLMQNNIEETWREDVSKVLNIGKMIEILYGNYCDLYIQAIGYGWEVEYMCHYYVVETPELVDALWEAVKATL